MSTYIKKLYYDAERKKEELAKKRLDDLYRQVTSPDDRDYLDNLIEELRQCKNKREFVKRLNHFLGDKL
jgi:transcription termination factor Rho